MENFTTHYSYFIVAIILLLIFAIHKDYIVLSPQFYLNHLKIKLNEIKIKINISKQNKMIKRFKKLSWISPMDLTEMHKLDDYNFKIIKLLDDRILLERLLKNDFSNYPNPNLELWIRKDTIPNNLHSVGIIFEVSHINPSNNLNFKVITSS